MIDFVKTRRSCRKYSDLPVPEDKLKKVLKAGLLAPSGRSKRPLGICSNYRFKKIRAFI